MSSYKNIFVDSVGAIRLIRINQPEKKNAVDGSTAEELFEAFKSFDSDPAMSVAVLSGEGKCFCAGADLKAFSQNENRNPLLDAIPGTLGPMGPTRLQLTKPVIAAIEGYAVAGGMELALWCDLRVVANDATFGIFCRRFGVPLIDMGTVRLPRLIGQSRAMDLILTGRPVDAKEALEIGLANRVCNPGETLDRAVELAETIAGFPQLCMRNDRLSVLQQWGLDTQTALAQEFDLGKSTIESGETVTGAKAFHSGKGRHGHF